VSWSYSRDLQGIRITVQGRDPEILERLEQDFDGFQPADGPTRITFSAYQADFSPPPGIRQSFRGRYGVCFDHGSTRYIWYPGPVWIVYDYDKDEGQAWGLDLEALYERLYLSLLSRVGELLEHRGLHRVHGLALSSPKGICLFLMRAGVGKSGLGYALLQRPGWSLLSEDTPLLDRRGRIHPFPFRIALRSLAGGESKTLVRASQFAIERRPGRCAYVFAGAWTTGESPAMGPLSKLELLTLLLRDGVVGLGVPQVVELFLRPGAREVIGKAGLLGGRLMANLPLLAASGHTLFLTPDGERNADFLQSWMGL
jgi:hypothetical protein